MGLPRCRSLAQLGVTPQRLITDKLRGYSAHRAVMPFVIHSTRQYENNRSEVPARLGYNGRSMPLYEYAYQECEREFEALVGAGETPACPSCHGSNLHRRLSVFAAHTRGASPAALPTEGACGTCGDPRGPGACSIN